MSGYDPFTLVVVADFAATRTRGEPWVRLRATSFPELFEELGPALPLESRDLLTGADRSVSWTFTLRAFRDFRPEALLRQLPPAAELLDWRDHLLTVMKSGRGLPGLQDQLDQLWPEVARSVPAEDPGVRDNQPVDDILDMVQLEHQSTDESLAAPGGAQDRITQALGNQSLDPRRRLTQAKATVDDALGRQLDIVLCDPGFRDLEAVWTQLAAIVEVADLRSGDLEVLVVPADRTTAAAALEQLRDGGEWRGALVVDHSVRSVEDSARILAEAGATGSALEGGALVPLAFEVEGEPPSDVPVLDADELLAASGAIREAVAALPLRPLLGCNRFLYRALYHPEDSPTPFESYREQASGPDGPYASAAWIAARGIAEGVKRAGPAGVRFFSCDVRGVPVRNVGDQALPLELVVKPSGAAKIVEAGVGVLTCEPGRDRVSLRAPAVVREPDDATRDPGKRSGSPGLHARFTVAPPRDEEMPE